MEGNEGVFFVAQLLLVDMQVTISCMDPMGTTNGCCVTEFPHSCKAPSAPSQSRKKSATLIRSWRHSGCWTPVRETQCHFSGQEAPAFGSNRDDALVYTKAYNMPFW